MTIRHLGIENFRILENVRLEPSPRLNLIFGDNAAGKTSVLEAVTVLSSARSFRSASLSDLVRHGSDGFRVTGKVEQRDGGVTPLGLQRDSSGVMLRVAGRPASRASELSGRLPVQVIHPDSHILVSGGPKQRRRFMDWGVFHVEHGFLEAWRRYDKALRQRNAALKTGGSMAAASAWDGTLGESAEVIHALRLRHIDALNAVLPRYTRAIAGDHDVSVEYRAGWDTGQPLAEVLGKTRDRDRRRGFTCAGPHRAELVFRVDGHAAENYVSRGQQKMLVVSLLLAQVALFGRSTGRRCVLLLDDLAAELDEAHRSRLLGVLEPMDVQIFITTVSRDVLAVQSWSPVGMFHVEQGRIREVV